jgi:hypothetical protein
MDIATHSDWGIHLKQVGLCTKQLRTFVDDPQRLLLGQTTLTTEVLFEEG